MSNASGAIVSAAPFRIILALRRPRSSGFALVMEPIRTSWQATAACARMDVRPDTLMIIDTHWFTTGFTLMQACITAAPTCPTRCPGTSPMCPTTTPAIPNWRSSVRSLAKSGA